MKGKNIQKTAQTIHGQKSTKEGSKRRERENERDPRDAYWGRGLVVEMEEKGKGRGKNGCSHLSPQDNKCVRV